MTYRYRQKILDHLAVHGIFPRSHTDPVIVRDYLKALYTMEIRTIRERQRAKERGEGSGKRPEYVNQVLELRAKYPALEIPVEWWVEKS